jgi:hypothetical protein
MVDRRWIMIVKNLESPVFYKKKRQPMTGRGVDSPKRNDQKTFDQYLIEAFQGEVVQRGQNFNRKLSDLTRDNLIRLGQN